MISTSDRIKNIVNVIEHETLVDVGTDHGFISILAVQSKGVKNVYACDVNRGPLNTCEKNITKYSLQDKIKTVLSDGLQKVECDYDSVTICGMGGMLLKNIIMHDAEKTKKFKQLVLQPQSDYYEVRKAVYELGFFIKEEIYFIDNIKNNGLDKYYIIFNCQKGVDATPSDKELHLGINIKKDTMETYKDFINMTYLKSKVALENLLKNSKNDVYDKQVYFEKIVSYCEGILNES